MTDSGGMSQQTGTRGQQVGSAGGDVKQMTVGQLIDVANQQNIDVSALNDLIGQVQSQIGKDMGGQTAEEAPPEPAS